MPALIKYLRVVALFVVLSSFNPIISFATHMVGDEFTYKYLGDSTSASGTFQKYRVTLNIYIDCLEGSPDAIAQDNPAYFGIFRGSGTLVRMDTTVYYTSVTSLAGTSIGPCGTGSVPSLCIQKKTFERVYSFPLSATGYTIVYQRCCKNMSLTNITDPLNEGATYFCQIPPSGVVTNNNSAVFNYDPPEIVSINTPFVVNSAATDADGDSLSYELCTGYNGASDPTNSKPLPSAPPFPPVTYASPLSFSNPMSCSVPVSIDPATGMLTGTPNLAGRYLICLCCHEWRGGVMINTINREFELAVGDFALDTYRPYAGNDTAIMVGETATLHGTGAASYLWTPGTYLSDTTISNPTASYPAAGTYTYILHGISDSGCHGTDTVRVIVLAHSEYRIANAFTPNNDGHNDYLQPVALKNSTLISFKVFNRDGKLLYTGNDQGAAWDGKFNGVLQPQGSYLWQIFYHDNNGQTQEMNGNATLLR